MSKNDINLNKEILMFGDPENISISSTELEFSIRYKYIFPEEQIIKESLKLAF